MCSNFHAAHCTVQFTLCTARGAHRIVYSANGKYLYFTSHTCPIYSQGNNAFDTSISCGWEVHTQIHFKHVQTFFTLKFEWIHYLEKHNPFCLILVACNATDPLPPNIYRRQGCGRLQAPFTSPTIQPPCIRSQSWVRGPAALCFTFSIFLPVIGEDGNFVQGRGWASIFP